MDAFTIGVVSNIGMMTLLALSAYLLLLVGEVSFGQQAFFGIGAYAAGIATALWGWPLLPALLFAALLGAATQFAIAIPTLRLRGFYFSIATLAFAEIVRILFELFHYQREIGGRLVGPEGEHGFRDVRYAFDNGITPLDTLLVIWALVGFVLAAFAGLERSRFGVRLRMIGEDDVLAALNGIDVTRYRLAVSAGAGALAACAGGFFIHSVTYVEPGVFGVMLGVHALAYGLIGGLGTAFGPLLGVCLDIGFLESFQSLSQYRMVLFGGLVVLLLVMRPRGLLDETAVHRLGRLFRGAR
ncbi:MAG: branched-chain amino acid ABC transporter permease [Castellaniella sp.]